MPTILLLHFRRHDDDFCSQTMSYYTVTVRDRPRGRGSYFLGNAPGEKGFRAQTIRTKLPTELLHRKVN